MHTRTAYAQHTHTHTHTHAHAHAHASTRAHAMPPHQVDPDDVTNDFEPIMLTDSDMDWASRALLEGRVGHPTDTSKGARAWSGSDAWQLGPAVLAQQCSAHGCVLRLMHACTLAHACACARAPSHTHTHAHTPHTHTHTLSHMHAHTHPHAHIHTHTRTRMHTTATAQSPRSWPSWRSCARRVACPGRSRTTTPRRRRRWRRWRPRCARVGVEWCELHGKLSLFSLPRDKEASLTLDANGMWQGEREGSHKQKIFRAGGASVPSDASCVELGPCCGSWRRSRPKCLCLIAKRCELHKGWAEV